LLAYLKEFDKATFTDAVTASRDERQEVYSWLFKTRHRSARYIIFVLVLSVIRSCVSRRRYSVF
jgi:hypothetical protein